MKASSHKKVLLRISAKLLPLVMLAGAVMCGGCSQSLVRGNKNIMELWTRAEEAYKNQDYQEAQELYCSILASGYVSAELLFNLGNCAVKLHDMARAIVLYRCAWYYAPSDADIRANLAYAISVTGAEEPADANPLIGTARKLSVCQWAFAATISVWTLSAVGIIYLLSPVRLRYLRRLLQILFVLFAITLVGLGSWAPLLIHPEAVTTGTTTPVYYAPIAGSTLHFYLPPGSIVTILQEADGWAKISAGPAREGWIQQAHMLVIPYLPSQADGLP